MVHQYKFDGYNIVLDVSSGAVHVVDDIAYDMIARFEDASREDILAEMKEKYAVMSNDTKAMLKLKRLKFHRITKTHSSLSFEL